jgi:predicted transcriptional regulator
MDGQKMRRSRIDIVVNILDVAKNGVNKTAIVYRSNINFTLAEKYLELLENQGLLENNSEKYITTDKGKIFLQKAKEITLQLEAPIQEANEIIPHLEPMQNAKEMIPWLEVPHKATMRSQASEYVSM